jgi:hypothetical protein
MTPNTNNALFLICSMSPAAKAGIETESYRQSVDVDESTDQHILESAFLNLTRDLETIGLVLNIDYADVFENNDTLFSFLTFSSYLLPNTLYQHLKHDSKLKDCVGHILEGNLGDHETLIQTYLSELGGLDGNEPLAPHLAELIDQYYSFISQTDVFTHYMTNLYSLIKSERLVTEFDADAHTAYRNRIRTLIVRFAKAIDAFQHHPVYDQLTELQNQIILDTVAPANFAAYNYIFTLNETLLPDDLVPSFNKQWYHYQVANRWCVHYYNVRNMNPLPHELIAMYCFLYAVHEDQAAYTKDVSLLFHQFPDATVKQTVDGLYQE